MNIGKPLLIQVNFEVKNIQKRHVAKKICGRLLNQAELHIIHNHSYHHSISIFIKYPE